MKKFLFCFLSTVALARETVPGQYESVPDTIRQWFKEQRSPSTGIPCCDVSDGYNTDAKLENGHWFVPKPSNPSEWVQVPDEVVIVGHGNPNGNHVVWWVGDAYIRCFVPGALI